MVRTGRQEAVEFEGQTMLSQLADPGFVLVIQDFFDAPYDIFQVNLGSPVSGTAG